MKAMSKKGTEHTLRVKEKYRKYFFLFIAFAVLFLVIPYCDDDLRWGSSVGMERLASWFEGYGGRYLGYIIIILLTKFYPLKVILQALTLTFLVYMLDQMAYEKQTEYISVIFLFFMPLSIFSDTIGWTSGFANYITSVTFSLIYMRYVFRRLDGEDVPASILSAIGFIALGLVNSLIVEHFTIYNFCLAVFMILYTLAVEKRVRLPEIGYLAGVVGGIALMFSNSTYSQVSSGDDFYRSVDTSNLASSIVNRFGRIINICYLELPLVVISITVIMFLIWKERRKELEGIVGKIADIGVALICFGNPIILLIDQTREYDHAAKNLVSLALLLLVLLAIVVTTGIFSLQAGRFWQCMGVIISIVIPTTPFLLVSPMSYRCFLGSYVFWIVFLYQLLALIPDTRDKILFNEKLQKYVKVVAFAAVAFYICIYASILRQDMQRLQYIRSESAKGAQKVTVGHLSNENFVRDITLREDWEWDGYKDFYGLDPDLIINVRRQED
jgi:hypothetical protein